MLEWVENLEVLVEEVKVGLLVEGAAEEVAGQVHLKQPLALVRRSTNSHVPPDERDVLQKLIMRLGAQLEHLLTARKWPACDDHVIYARLIVEAQPRALERVAQSKLVPVIVGSSPAHATFLDVHVEQDARVVRACACSARSKHAAHGADAIRRLRRGSVAALLGGPGRAGHDSEGAEGSIPRQDLLDRVRVVQALLNDPFPAVEGVLEEVDAEAALLVPVFHHDVVDVQERRHRDAQRSAISEEVPLVLKAVPFRSAQQRVVGRQAGVHPPVGEPVLRREQML
mmetsp:Transcript_9287/g.34802  ORF Transcript_9287/g.34802 Transcript_9287/m.34802 type:complete len:284 (+) Transcript_9287:141-992(+)